MALSVLQRASKGSEADRRALVKQNCSDCMMTVMPCLNAVNDNSNVTNIQICSDILSAVVTEEQTQQHMNALQAVAAGDITDASSIVTTIEVVSNLASVEKNSAILLESGVASALVSTIASMASTAPGTEGKELVLQRAMRGLGRTFDPVI